MGYACVVAAVAGLVIGFVAGLVTLRRSQQWCPACGDTLKGLRCVGDPAPPQARQTLRAGRPR